MNPPLVKVLLIGTSDDTRLLGQLAGGLDRLFDNRDRFDLRAFASPLGPDRPIEYEMRARHRQSSCCGPGLPPGAEWLVESVDVARKLASVVVGVSEAAALPRYMRGMPVVDITAWGNDGDVRSLQPLDDLFHCQWS